MGSRTGMIVEDNPDLALVFAEALKASNFEIEIIKDGQKALERLKIATPDVVVLDLHLPHVSGDVILEHIRADERLAETRVMIATADPRMAELLEDQADLVLLKPISFNQLRDLAARMAPSQPSEET